MPACPRCDEPQPDPWFVSAHLALRHGELPSGEVLPLVACPTCGVERPAGLVDEVHRQVAHRRHATVTPLPPETTDADTLVPALRGGVSRVRVTVTDPRRGETRTFTVRGGERCCHLAPALTGNWVRDAERLDAHRRHGLVKLRRGILAAATGETVTTATREAFARQVLVDAAQAGDETAAATLRTLAELPRRWGERHPRALVQAQPLPKPPVPASGPPVAHRVETPALPSSSGEAGTQPGEGLPLPPPWLPPSD